MHFLLIFRSQPSGNCLYSSLSILLFGNNGYIDELRVLSSIELFMYPSCITVSIHVFYHYLKLLKKLKHTFLLCPLRILLLIVIWKMKRQLSLKLKLVVKVKNGQVFCMYYPCQCHNKKTFFPFSGLWRWNAKGFEKSSDLPKSRMSFRRFCSCFIL